MNLRYRYTVSDSALSAFANSSKKEREQLLRIFAGLGNNPFLQGSLNQATLSGRIVQSVRLGKWLITFWPDHGSKEVYIVDVTSIAN
jgi:hypothetical protein